MRRLIPVLLVIVLLASGAATAVKASPTHLAKTQITFWDTANETEQVAMKKMVADCTTANPDLDVKYEYVPFDQGQNKFKTAAQANNAPDVMRAEIAWTPEFAALGFLADITDKISDADKKDFLPAPFAYNVYQDKVYGLPQVTDAPAMLYNKALFKAAGLDPEKPPKTMDEFVKAAQKLTKADGSQWGYMLTDGSYFFLPFMWAYGGGLIDAKDLSIHIADQGTIDALNFVLDLRDKYKVMPTQYDPPNQYNNAMAAFKSGKVAILFNGPWSRGDILTGDAFKDPANFGVAPIPAGPDGKQGSPVGGHNYVIYAGSPNIDAAYTFISCMDSAKEQIVQAKANGTLPTRVSSYDDPDLQKDAITQGFLEQMKVATNRPVIPQGGQIFDALDKAWTAVLTGTAKPADAVKDIEKAWKTLLEQ